MKKSVLTYAAGVLDVRGSIRINITTYSSNGTPLYYPIVRLVVNKDKYQVLKYLKDEFGGCVSIADYNRLYWQVGLRKAYNFIKKVKPYFKNSNKIRQAQEIIDFYENPFYNRYNI